MDATSIETMRERARSAARARGPAERAGAAPPSTALTHPWRLPAGGGALVVTLGIAAAVTITMFLAMLALASNSGGGFEPKSDGVVAVAAVIIVLTLVAVLWMLDHDDVPVLARAAIVLTGAQVAIAAGALVLWWLTRPSVDPALSERYRLVDTLPAPAIAVVLGVGVMLAAARARGRRAGPPAWLHATVVAALTFLLGLALWLPICARLGTDALADDWVPSLSAYLPAVLLPPAGIALLAAGVARWWPQALRRLTLPLGVAVAFALFVALAARAESTTAARQVYANFAHVLFSASTFALSTLLALAWSHGRTLRATRRDRLRAAPWNQQGTVVIEPPSSTTVGTLVHTGWLSGVRPSVRGFTLRTATADLPIPAGTAMVAPVPPWTAQAAVGTAVPILSEGDEVTVSGFVAPPGDAIYRGASVPIAGTDGLVVTVARRADEPPARDLLLWLWRPCAVFLAVLSIASLPGLLGLAVAPAELPRPPSRRTPIHAHAHDEADHPTMDRMRARIEAARRVEAARRSAEAFE